MTSSAFLMTKMMMLNQLLKKKSSRKKPQPRLQLQHKKVKLLKEMPMLTRRRNGKMEIIREEVKEAEVEEVTAEEVVEVEAEAETQM